MRMLVRACLHSSPLSVCVLTDCALCMLCKLLQVRTDRLEVIVHHIAYKTQHLHSQHTQQR